MNELRSRNSRLRWFIEQKLEEADFSVREAVYRIATEVAAANIETEAVSVEAMHANLRRRIDTLVHAGLASTDDLQGLL